MRSRLTTIAVLIFAVLTCIWCSSCAAQTKNHYITDDFGGVLKCKSIEDIERFCGIMLSAKPALVALDASSPDICNYPTKFGYFKEHPNHVEMYKAGIDPYGVVSERMKNAGLLFAANIRMNDHHGNIETWTPWAQEHKHWSLGEDTGERDWMSVGMLRRMDYAVEGVRDYRLAIIKEVIERYDVDAIQLDFGRTAPFLSEPKTTNAKFMTMFVRDVRAALDEAAKKTGSKKMLGVIVPWDMDFCQKEGLDAQGWIKAGLIDYICPGEFYYSDYNIDVERWSEVTKGTKCKLYPLLLGDIAPVRVPHWNFQKGNLPMLGESAHLNQPRITAFAELYYSQDADGIMFYNYYTYNFGRHYPSLSEIIDQQKIADLPRQYWYCKKNHFDPTEHYNFKFGQPFEHLPLYHAGSSASTRLRFGADLGDNKATFRFKLKNAGKADVVKAFINGNEIEIALSEHKEFTNSENQTYNVSVWQTALDGKTLRKGINDVKIEIVKTDLTRTIPMGLGEFEIFIDGK